METNLEPPNSSSTSTSLNIHADFLSPPNSSSTSIISNGDDFLSPPSSTSTINNGDGFLSPPTSTSNMNNGDEFLSPLSSTSTSTFNNGGETLSSPCSTSTVNNGGESQPLSTPSSTSTVKNGAEFLSPPSSTSTVNNGGNEEQNDEDDDDEFYNDDSNCSTPYVSAPSSPGRYSYLPSSGFFYSAPTSPMHFILATANSRSSLLPATSDASSTSNNSFEFEFSARFDSPTVEIGSSMCSADELFLNGQIRPMKLCAHLQRPQKLPSMTLLESQREIDDDDDEISVDDDDRDVFRSSRDLRYRSRSQRRRTRSLSPLRSTKPFEWNEERESRGKNDEGMKEKEGDGDGDGEGESETTPSGSSSRCSSAGRSSKRWVFLKDFLRSKSEGRSNNKFWHNINISFSPAKERREKERGSGSGNGNANADVAAKKKEGAGAAKGKGTGSGKRRSAHEAHYAANRAQAEELRKKTFLPYRQGLLGCLGFNSRSYGALNGFARALNPVSSR